jgi:hypothetical protein
LPRFCHDLWFTSVKAWTAITLWFLAAVALSGGGCASAPKAPQPIGKAVIKIDPDVRPTKATVQVANEVVVVLPPGRPGDTWRITQHNAVTLRQLTDIVPAPDGSGEFTISFMAMRSGLTRLLFALVPAASGTGVAPADMREIQLTIE